MQSHLMCTVPVHVPCCSPTPMNPALAHCRLTLCALPRPHSMCPAVQLHVSCPVKISEIYFDLAAPSPSFCALLQRSCNCAQEVACCSPPWPFVPPPRRSGMWPFVSPRLTHTNGAPQTSRHQSTSQNNAKTHSKTAITFDPSAITKMHCARHIRRNTFTCALWACSRSTTFKSRSHAPSRKPPTYPWSVRCCSPTPCALPQSISAFERVVRLPSVSQSALRWTPSASWTAPPSSPTSNCGTA